MNSVAAKRAFCLALVALAFLVAVSLSDKAALAATERFSVADVPNVHLMDKTQYVSDPANQLSGKDKNALNRRAADMEQSLGVQVAVVVLKDIGDNDAREFATELFNAWGIGEKGKDTGLLILLITDPPQRSIIFETGYGLEGVLPDAIAFRLQQRYMVPSFQNGEWGSGLVSGLDAVGTYLGANPEDRREIVGPAIQQQEELSPLSVIFMVIGFFFLVYLFRRNPAAFALILSSILSGRGGRGGGFGGGSWGGGGSGGGGSMSRF